MSEARINVMKLFVVRQAVSRVPRANSQETAFLMLHDNEEVVHTETFDNNLFLLIAHTSPPTEIPEGLMDEPGHIDTTKAPEWVPFDIHGDIEHFDGETQLQAFIRHWDTRPDERKFS